MNRKILVVFATLIAVAMLALPMSAVSATKPAEIVDCSFAVDISATISTLIKGPLGTAPIYIFEMTGEDCFTFAGDISGTASYSARWVSHGEMGVPDTVITYTGYIIFEEATVTVGDVTATGGLVIKETGNGQHQGGLWSVISSDLEDQYGEPVSLHGRGEFLLPEILFAPYDVVGQLHFDP